MTTQVKPCNKFTAMLIKIVTWPRVYMALAFSLIGLFVVQYINISNGLLWFVAVCWIISLLVLLPIRVFLDRIESRLLLGKLQSGNINKKDLSRFQLSTLLSQSGQWPKGLGWLGARWFEMGVWVFIILLVLLIAIPLILHGLDCVFQ